MDLHTTVDVVRVCTRMVDAPLSGRAVVELVKRCCARAGVDAAGFSGHSLRAG